MAAQFNPEPLVAEALALVRHRRAVLAATGHNGEGAFTLGRLRGDLLLMGGEFQAPYQRGGWKVLCRIPAGATHAETAPGVNVKAGPAGPLVTARPVKARPKVLAEGLDRMAPEALAEVLHRLAGPMVRILDIRAGAA